jgi:hypothetical protein
MKIISKYKDYYDYLVGIYGEDPLAVFDRRFDVIQKPSIFADEYVPYEIAIAGKIFKIYQYREKFYYTPEELFELNALLLDANKRPLAYSHRHRYDKREISIETFRHMKEIDEEKSITDINHLLRKPILLRDHFGTLIHVDKSKNESKWSVIRLEDFHINKYVDPSAVFREISGFLLWLNDNPEIPNNQTNNEKIVTHGFDLKHSFRNTK